MNKNRLFAVGILLCGSTFSSAQASSLNDYLLVGQFINDTGVDVSNYELGRVGALAASAPTDFGTVNSVSGIGPTLDTPFVDDADQDWGYNNTTGNAQYDGNVAITSATGTVKLSDVNIYADRGIDCPGLFSTCTNGTSETTSANSDIDGTGSNNQYDDAQGGNGLRTLGPRPFGVTGEDGVNANESVRLAGVQSEIETVRTFVTGLDANSITNFIMTKDGGSGDIEVDTLVDAGPGLSIWTFDSGTNDITVKANLIFNGGPNTFILVLVNDGALFKTSQGNLIIGDGGIGLNNVMIASRNPSLSSTVANIDLSNSNINGVSLYDVGTGGIGMSNLSADNVSGCTQFVGNDVDIQNVRLSRCAFNTSVIPVPAAAWLFGSALLGLGWVRLRMRS